MEEKKNNLLIHILVLILGILIGVLGAFVLQKNGDNKEEQTKLEEKERGEEPPQLPKEKEYNPSDLDYEDGLDINSKLLDKVKKLTIDFGAFDNPIFEKNINITNDDFVFIAYENIDKEIEEFNLLNDSNNCFNVEKNEFLSECEFKENEVYDELKERLDASVLRKEYKELFDKEPERKKIYTWMSFFNI